MEGAQHTKNIPPKELLMALPGNPSLQGLQNALEKERLLSLAQHCRSWAIPELLREYFPPGCVFPTVGAAVALGFWTFPLFLFSSSFTGSFTRTPW